MRNLLKHIAIIVCTMIAPLCSSSENVRIINVWNGLTSQSVLKLCQTRSGFVLAGTYTGLNLLNGLTCQPFGIGISPFMTAGSMIDDIQNGKGFDVWVHTNMGLEKFDFSNGTLEYHPEISGTFRMATNRNGVVVIMKDDGKVYLYDKETKKFNYTNVQGKKYGSVLSFYIDKNNYLHVVYTDYIAICKIIKDKNDQYNLKSIQYKKPKGPNAKGVWYRDDMLFVLDVNNNIFQTSIGSNNWENLTPTLVYNIGNLVKERGNASTITHDGKDIIVGFQHGGAVRLKYNKKSPKAYTEDVLPIHGCVLDILKDRNQDILWFATDGAGIYQINRNMYHFHNEILGSIDDWLISPTRALYKDDYGNMWVGTKDNGILLYSNYQPFGEPVTPQYINSTNSSLVNNSVYCFAPSHNNILWIGSDGDALNYYSYDSQKIETLEVGDGKMYNVHDLLETNSSELWVTTGGHGVFRISFGYDEKPYVRSVKQLFFDKVHPGNSQFTNMSLQDNRYLWIGSRNKGLYRYDLKTGEVKIFYFGDKENNPKNDILSVRVLDNGHVYCATSAGLIKLYDTNYPIKWCIIGRQAPLNGSIVFRSATSYGNMVWAAASNYVIAYNDKTNSLTRLTSDNGIKVSEFSDGAAYYDAQTGIKYFGGTNGFVAISSLDSTVKSNYHPRLYFQSIAFGDSLIAVPMQDKAKVEIPYSNNNFVLNYNVPDYIEGESYFFEYRFNDSDTWIGNGNKKQLSFTSFDYGTYNLQIRYIKDNYTSPIYKLTVCVLPPWYLTWWMKTLYLLLILAVASYIVFQYLERQKEKQKRLVNEMNQQRKEEVYTSKLRFFTNVTYEFSQPLSLIVGPCQRILDISGIDSQVRHYVEIIQRNCKRLGRFISEILEFQRIESSHREINIVSVDVSDETTNLADMFSVMAESRHIKFTKKLQTDLIWGTDYDAFINIVTNLLSYSFKRVHEHGSVAMSLVAKDDTLVMKFSNTGKAIPQEKFAKMFDQYNILDSIESEIGNAKDGALEIAISRGLILLLKGKLDMVTNDGINTFTVRLPKQEVNDTATEDTANANRSIIKPVEIDDSQPKFEPNNKISNDKPTIVLIEDNDEMLWLINDCFEQDYNVVSFRNSKDALEELVRYSPEVIMSEINIQPQNGIEVCQHLKQSTVTSHIPVILISTVNDDKTRIDALEAGSDAYIPLPCDINYMQSVINKFMKSNKSLKNYYESSLLSYEFLNSKFIHKEDKELFDNMMNIIKENLTNPELSTQFIASRLGLGVRNLYRRMQNITDKKPSTFIKEARLEKARQLLTKSKMSMEEVCYNSGFVNRGTFYKLFVAKFNCTPKQYHDKMIAKAEEMLSDYTDDNL